MTYSFFLRTLVALGGAFLIGAGFPVDADEPPPLLEELFGSLTDSKKKTTSSTSKKSSSSSSNKSKSSSSSESLFSSFSKTPEERAKEEAARKKAAAAKAKADARKKYLADLEKKKTDQAKARLAAEREKARAREKSLEAAQKKKADAERAKKLAEKKRLDDARKKALAEKKLKEERARKLAADARARDAARRNAKEAKLRQQRERDADLIAQARGRQRRSSGGLFGIFGKSSNSRGRTVHSSSFVQSPPDRYLYINERKINELNSSNSRIEIDLSDQRARVYAGNTLMIETQISTGKPGFRTPTGYYSVKEKLRDKRSGRYGTWFSGSGAQLRGDDSFNPPPGAVRFVGAEMPYWMRVTGGIGMHIGYVPNGAASHGCIRVPSNIQPLIYSKVRVGTPLRIKG